MMSSMHTKLWTPTFKTYFIFDVIYIVVKDSFFAYNGLLVDYIFKKMISGILISDFLVVGSHHCSSHIMVDYSSLWLSVVHFEAFVGWFPGLFCHPGQSKHKLLELSMSLLCAVCNYLLWLPNFSHIILFFFATWVLTNVNHNYIQTGSALPTVAIW